MALGRQKKRQAELVVGWAELPRSPGHAFYDRLQAVLVEAGFDDFAEMQCKPTGFPDDAIARRLCLRLAQAARGLQRKRA